MSTKILKIDTNDDSFEYISFFSIGVPKPFYLGCSAVEQFVFCAPNMAKKVMKIDTTTDTVTTLQNDLGNGQHK